MAEQRLDGMKIAILVTDGFELAELIEPRKALQQAGAITTIVAPQEGRVQGMHHDEKADRLPVELKLEEARADAFDGVLLPGGALNADALRINPAAQAFIKEIDRARKPIAVICHAPWLLVSARLVAGRQLTSYPTLQDDIRNAGGHWEDREVLTDGNWVSSRMPKDIPAFNREMIRLFGEHWSRAAHRAA